MESMRVQMWVEKLAVEWVKVSGSMLMCLLDQEWVKELVCELENSWELLCWVSVLEQMLVHMWVEKLAVEWV